MSNLLEQASLVMIPSGYKEDVVYSEIPIDGSGDLQLTRASDGTRVNSAGLVEVCPWNLLQYSEDFANAFWGLSGGGTITSNTTTAPNGTLTADTLTWTSGTAYLFNGSFNLPIGEFTQSVYAKANASSSISLEFVTSGFARGAACIFDLSNGTAGTLTIYGGVSGFTATIESVGNGWYRCSIGGTITIADTYFWELSITSGSVYIWGAQLNIGSTAKPYFPTTDRLNVPRLTYQNGGGGCPSLLLEKQSTNLCTYSQDFSNAAWDTSVDSGCSVTITPNYTTASNGLPAARLVASRTNTSTLAVIVNYAPNTGTTATKSIWMKNNNSGNVTIMFGDEAVTITDSWERYSVTNTYLYSIVGLRYSGVALSCDISITGSQFELGSYPTSYIPTTSSSATRVADACSKTGISSLIGQTEGVLFVEVKNFVRSASSLRLIAVSDGGFNNRIVILTGSFTNLINVIIVTAASTQADYTAEIGANVKIALAYSSAGSVLYVNGAQVGSSSSMSVPATSQLFIGTREDGTTGFAPNGTVAQSILFPTRLTNAECISLTT